MHRFTGTWLALFALVVAVVTPSAMGAGTDSSGLAGIKHVILFMQENRSFDHYFGTMAGVRGFKDPNVVVSSDTGKPSFYSPVSQKTMQDKMPLPPSGVNYLLPWYWNHEGGDANEKYQCAIAGSNGWKENHQAYNGGTSNRWAEKNTPYSLGYQKRQDIPLHFALAEGWTIADGYHESVISSTNPNRVAWASGSSGIQQSRKGLGGPALDNHESPGCEKTADGTPVSCYPYKWKTMPEYLQDAGISWQVYQNKDNFDDNPLAFFSQFQKAKSDSPLAQRGLSFIGLQRFYDDAKAGKLPQVSFIIGPTDLSEHPPNGPTDGAWLQQQVVNAVTKGKNWNESALIISYDETGGWADHVMAPLPDKSVTDEYYPDLYNASLGLQPNGPGFRVPFYVISPWTRKGGVFSELASHESQTLFLEKWASAIGKPFETSEINEWRRSHLSDLTGIFDFAHPDLSLPKMPTIRKPWQDVFGNYNGNFVCHLLHWGKQPSVPYTQKDKDALVAEKGFKPVRGLPSEGHYVTFESEGRAIAAVGGKLTAQPSAADHSSPAHRFILHAVSRDSKDTFYIQADGIQGTDSFITADHSLGPREKASPFTFKDLRNGNGYTVTSPTGPLSPSDGPKGNLFLFYVTY